MNPQNEISSFFTQVTKAAPIVSKTKKNIEAFIFICAMDYGWSQQDYEECDIPYLLCLLNKRTEIYLEEEAKSKKLKKRR